MDLDQYDVVSLTDALRGFLQELPVPIIPAAVYSELVYTAQGTVFFFLKPQYSALMSAQKLHLHRYIWFVGKKRQIFVNLVK